MSSEQEDQQQRQQQSLHSSSSSLDLPTTPLAASNNLSPSATQSLPLAPLGDQLILPSDMKNSPIIVPSSPAETLRAETLPTPPTPDAVQPSVTSASHLLQQSLSINNLEQEVGQVMGTFNSWWGGVKKQSASAISSIKADIDKTVTQAQADIEFLRTAKVEIVRKTGQDSGASDLASTDPIDTKGKGRESASRHDDGVPSSPPSLFDKLTSSTSQLQQSLQSTFQSTIASASNNPALSNPLQLRAHLAENLRLSSAKENLQLSMKQAEKMAEEYLRKGDQWVKDAEKWMGEAVKVVPPDGADGSYIAASFDGGDLYSFSTSTSTPEKLLFDADARTPRPSTSAALAGSRKDTLLQRLREDKQLLLVDPMGSDETSERHEEFAKWQQEQWSTAGPLKEAEVGNVGELRMALVPELLSDEQFWQRYLFHKYMIEAEDDKRRKLLAATSHEAPDDFSWDDEPEDANASRSSAPAVVKQPDEAQPAAVNIAKSAGTAVPIAVGNSTSTSPRDSEESYDLVSDQGPKKSASKPIANDADEEEDSDWE